MILEHRRADDDGVGRDATRPTGEPDPWGVCDILLVANRTRGTTHKFFRDWRFEAVACHGRPGRGAVLVAVPLDPRTLAASGWRYDLVQIDERPGLLAPGAASFAWTATNAPGTADPLAAGAREVRAWLAAHGWEPDPLRPARYHG